MTVWSHIILLGLLFNTHVTYAGSIIIRWDPNHESDLNGYKVYHGTASNQYTAPVDVGKVTSYELEGLESGRRYFISLTAYDTSGNESAKSAEVDGLAEERAATTTTMTTTVLPATTTAPGTTSVPNTSTIATTTLPGSTTIPPTTSSTVPNITTTSTIPDDVSSCEEPQKLIPLSVAASSELPPFFAKDNLIDGDPQTAWSTVLSLFRKDASITLDLGSMKSISSLSMYASRIFGIDFLPANIQVQISNDNSVWQTIETGPGYNSLHPPYADSWPISGHQCRYLKVCISGRKGLFFFQLAQIAELEVYGCEPDAKVMKPARENHFSRAIPVHTEGGKENHHHDSQQPMPPGIPGKPIVSFQ